MLAESMITILELQPFISFPSPNPAVYTQPTKLVCNCNWAHVSFHTCDKSQQPRRFPLHRVVSSRSLWEIHLEI